MTSQPQGADAALDEHMIHDGHQALVEIFGPFDLAETDAVAAGVWRRVHPDDLESLWGAVAELDAALEAGDAERARRALALLRSVRRLREKRGDDNVEEERPEPRTIANLMKLTRELRQYQQRLDERENDRENEGEKPSGGDGEPGV